MLLFINVFFSMSLQVSGWKVFEDTRFKWQWVDELDAEVEIPYFSNNVKGLNGKEITLTGHFLPADMDGNSIILSKFPYASCFFCGGAGPESVAEVMFGSVQRPFRVDEIIKVKGRLKLNRDDYEHLVFMLTDAKLIE